MQQAAYFKNLIEFKKENNETIFENLVQYVPDNSSSQLNAWKDSLKVLKNTIKNLNFENNLLESSFIILEYTIPLEERRIDAVLLLNNIVLVIEFKGKNFYSQGDLDQANGYARDLRDYHSLCLTNDVNCCLVLTKAKTSFGKLNELSILNANDLTNHCHNILSESNKEKSIDLNKFLSIESYKPLPSLIKAARELFYYGNLERIHRTSANTKPTLGSCFEIINNTRRSKRKSLILINGAPGAGKTLVGLKLAYENYFSNSSEDKVNDNPIAIFLSGNAPLVEVLQYEFKKVGGGGKTFVRGVHDYVSTFSKSSEARPPHNILIFDEAQRAFDAKQVEVKQKHLNNEYLGLSEPELFIKFAEKVSNWCVVVGLIGTGQEIHIGEEGGVSQWKDAIINSTMIDEWDIYIPNSEEVKNSFKEIKNLKIFDSLNLSKTIRFHSAKVLYEFVDNLLKGNSKKAKELSFELESNNFNLRLTHKLDLAKNYLQDRFEGNKEARYGVIASSRDKDLNQYGIEKGFKSPNEVRSGQYGEWFSNPKGLETSCNNLNKVITEFGVQGLELDFSLLAWGTDLIRQNNSWNNFYASKYQDISRIKSSLDLRINTYRVLLTRGREGIVIYIPPIPDKMRETYKYLKDCGFTEIKF